MDQKELIQACKKNEYTAQMHVYTLYKDMMYNVSWRILRRREDAEDVVQDSFIKGFQKIGKTSDDMNLGAWLRKITINHSLDVLKKRKRINWVEESFILEKEYIEVEFPEENSITVAHIKTCLNELKDKYRIILVLYLIEGYNHREIGELLDLKFSTVRNQYRRGKLQLLELIKNKNSNEIRRIHTEK
ncbi:MAG: RNA polymerase sigma factor [Cellulophaga sp.]